MQLTTPRLLLRPWRDEDLQPFAELNADPEVMRHFPAPLSLEETRGLLAAIRHRTETHGFCWMAAERPGVAPFIGFIGLNVPSIETHFTPCVEIGWRLARAHWGQGLATEGARALLEHAFGPMGLAEVVAFTARGNRPSIRVMEKLGMTRDPSDDFNHPMVPAGHRLSECVLYRATPDLVKPRI